MSNSSLMAVALLLAVSTKCYAETDLPQSGICQPDDDALSLMGVDSIAWTETNARVIRRGDLYDAEIVGARIVDGGFRFSVRFDDPILGYVEVAIFQRSYTSPPTYRMGMVGYENLASGDRVIEFMSGFHDASCSVVSR